MSPLDWHNFGCGGAHSYVRTRRGAILRICCTAHAGGRGPGAVQVARTIYTRAWKRNRTTARNMRKLRAERADEGDTDFTACFVYGFVLAHSKGTALTLYFALIQAREAVYRSISRAHLLSVAGVLGYTVM